MRIHCEMPISHIQECARTENELTLVRIKVRFVLVVRFLLIEHQDDVLAVAFVISDAIESSENSFQGSLKKFRQKLYEAILLGREKQKIL